MKNNVILVKSLYFISVPVIDFWLIAPAGRVCVGPSDRTVCREEATDLLTGQCAGRKGKIAVEKQSVWTEGRR